MITEITEDLCITDGLNSRHALYIKIPNHTSIPMIQLAVPVNTLLGAQIFLCLWNNYLGKCNVNKVHSGDRGVMIRL